jgi:lipid-A-disaccharide synthase
MDHMLLLFNFEKKYFDKEDIQNTFVGHPLLEHNTRSKIDLSSLINKNKNIISIFAGSRKSETNVLLPILCDFIKLMNKNFDNYVFIFHATDENKELIVNFIKKNSLNNTQVISDENIKTQILFNSVFAVAKSGTVSLEICNASIPSIIIYKINMINYLIMKSLVKVKFANIINIINNKEIIPELLQGECNAKEIYNSVVYLLKNPKLMKDQVDNCNKTLNDIRSKSSSSSGEASSILNKYLT